MKEYMVSLDLVSHALDLSEIAARVGAAPGLDSHSRGEKRFRGEKWTASVWRLSSKAGEAASLDLHLKDLRTRAEDLDLLNPERVPIDISKILNIATVFDSAYCTVELSSTIILPFLLAGYQLEVTAYPSEGDGR